VTGLSAIGILVIRHTTVLSPQDRGERERQREETLSQKDKEKEMDAIRVSGGYVDEVDSHNFVNPT